MGKRFERESELIETAIKLMDTPSERRTKLISEYQRRSEQAFAAETLRNYKLAIRQFRSWCDEMGHRSKPPIDPIVVADYVEHMGGKLRPNTIETRLWAIAEYHRANFERSPTRHPLVSQAVKGIKRTYGAATNQAHPMCKREVLRIVDGLGNRRIDIRDKALLWLASDSWCRASELVAFRVRDVSTQEDGSSILFVRRSKTDQFDEGDYAYLSPRGTRAVFRWVELAGLKLGDPVITKSQRGAKVAPMDAATVSRIFKRVAGRKDVSAHSTRIGGVHDAFRIGCDLASIMVSGRWKSPEMPARYGRRILAGQSAAARVCAAFEETR